MGELYHNLDYEFQMQGVPPPSWARVGPAAHLMTDPAACGFIRLGMTRLARAEVQSLRDMRDKSADRQRWDRIFVRSFRALNVGLMLSLDRILLESSY